MNQPSVSGWVVQVPLWPSGLGVGLWSERPRFDPRPVRYTGGSGNPGLPVSGSSPPWFKVAQARGLGFRKGGSNVTNQPSVSDWVVQVPLWPSGLGVGLWSERPGVRSLHGPLQYKVWDGVIYPFPNFNGSTLQWWSRWSLGIDK